MVALTVSALEVVAQSRPPTFWAYPKHFVSECEFLFSSVGTLSHLSHSLKSQVVDLTFCEEVLDGSFGQEQLVSFFFNLLLLEVERNTAPLRMLQQMVVASEWKRERERQLQSML